MTLGQLVVDLKNIIGPGISVDDPGLTTWINEAYLFACDEISKNNPDYFTRDQVANSILGQQEYTLPSDFERMLMVNILYNGVWRRALPLSGVNDIPVISNTLSAQGFTYDLPRYYILGDINGIQKIGFMPIPSDNANNGIKIWYVFTPPELATSGDIPAFPKKYHHLIKLGAYANYLDQDDQHAEADSMRNRFEDRVLKMIESMEDNQVDANKSIIITNNYDLYVDQGYI